MGSLHLGARLTEILPPAPLPPTPSMGSLWVWGDLRPTALEQFALHVGRNRDVELFEDGGGHVHQLQTIHLAATGALFGVGIVLDDHAVLGVIAVIGAGIVVDGVDGIVADGAYGAPEEITKVNDQIGWNTVG